jgi:hypothetical protein
VDKHKEFMSQHILPLNRSIGCWWLIKGCHQEVGDDVVHWSRDDLVYRRLFGRISSWIVGCAHCRTCCT